MEPLTLVLYVVRHGETTHNAAGIIQGPRIDSELSERGIQQADALRNRFSDVHLDAVYASPLRRAQDTARALTNGAPVMTVPDLHEMDFGHYCGQLRQPLMPEISRIFEAWQAGFPEVAFPGGESAVMANFRIRDIVERVKHEENVAVVAHGRINRVLLAAVTGSGLGSFEQYPQDNAAITAVQNGQVIAKNDTRHLA